MRYTRPLFVLLSALLLSVGLYAQSAPAAPVESLDDMSVLEERVKEVIAQSRAAVVGIQVEGGGSGSGTLVSEDGWIATAGHVTGPRPGTQAAVTLADGRVLPGVTCGIHMAMDYGLVKVEAPEGETLPTADFGDSDQLIAGQWVVAMGHPLGIEPGRGPVVRLGRIIMPKNERAMITLDAPLIGGDSGGPIFDLGGNLVAINQSISPLSVEENIVTPTNGFQVVFERLKDSDAMGQAQTWGTGGGVQPEISPDDVEDYEDAMAAMLDGRYEEAASLFEPLAEREKSIVTILYNAACAFSLWSAELKGKEAEARAEQAVRYFVESIDAGWDDLEHVKSDTDLDPIRSREDFMQAVESLRRSLFNPVLGLTLKGADEGVRVTKVAENSSAEQAGFEVGDVITEINGEHIHGAVDFANALANADLSSKTDFTVTRKRESIDIVFALLKDEALGSLLEASEHKNGEKLLGYWGANTRGLSQAVYNVMQEGKFLAIATAVSHEGFLVTKASEIDLDDAVMLRDDDGELIPAEVAGVDDELDIALLKVDHWLDSIVDFEDATHDPEIGSLLASVRPNGEALTFGIVALPGYNSKSAGERPFVGIGGENSEEGGFVVLSIVPGSPAEKAGFKVGDRIFALDGDDIPDWFTAIAMIQSHEVGETVVFEGERDGRHIDIELKLVTRNSVENGTPDVAVERSDAPPLLGFRGKNTEGHKGVIVLSMERSGPADDAGLRVDDLVVGLGRTQIRSRDDLREALKGRSPGDELQLRALRGERELSLTLVLGEKLDGMPRLGIKIEASEEGIVISEITAGGPADGSGLEAGDLLQAMDGYVIKSTKDLISELEQRRPHQVVTIRVVREGEWLDIELKLGAKEDDEQAEPEAARPSFGFTLAELEEGEIGLEVTEIKPNSAAAAARLKVGDVILRVGSHQIRSLDQMREVLEELTPGSAAAIRVRRETRQGVRKLTLSLPVPGGAQPGGPGGGHRKDPRIEAMKGEVSARADGFGAVIQHDGVVTPRQCGGPVVDLEGRVVGLNIARSDRTRTFALPSSRVHKAVSRLIAEATR